MKHNNDKVVNAAIDLNDIGKILRSSMIHVIEGAAS